MGLCCGGKCLVPLTWLLGCLVCCDLNVHQLSTPLQNPETHKITDFFTFYSLPSTVVRNAKHSLLEAAYLFYYATDVAFEPGAEEDGRLKKRLQQLIGDALIIAAGANFDVFNALSLMDNNQFLDNLKVRETRINFLVYTL